MLVLFFVCIILPSLANAQDYPGSDSDSSYGNSSSCIRRYRDLQSYVVNNEDLMDDLSELFFETGKTATEFVRITYRFKIFLPADNNMNHTTDDTKYYDEYDGDDDESEFICINDQKKFI